jgi:hypothetical protein
MTRDQVQTDETGLHAVECECVLCDTGYRPTELERSTARRALALQRAALAKLARLPAAAPLPREAGPRYVQRPTPEQFEELRKLREGFGK